MDAQESTKNAIINGVESVRLASHICWTIRELSTSPARASGSTTQRCIFELPLMHSMSRGVFSLLLSSFV